MSNPDQPTPEPLEDREALAAIRRVRAISWRWRWREVAHAPRIMLGLGRRHYGVAAQDVERELGGREPGIVSCTRKRACPRHRGSTVDADLACVGRLMVDYRLLAEVVAQARRCVGLPGPVEASSAGPRRPRLPRRCYEQIAAIQLHCLPREGPSAGR